MNAKKPQLNPMLKIVLDLGPLVLFFVANSRPALFLPLVAPILPADIATGERAGIFVATAVFMVAIVAALVVSYVMTRHLPVMPLVTAIIVLVFGSLTLVLHDEHFIKLKPTIIYLLFAGVLLCGLVFGKPVLGVVFDSVFHLTEQGWRLKDPQLIGNAGVEASDVIDALTDDLIGPTAQLSPAGGKPGMLPGVRCRVKQVRKCGSAEVRGARTNPAHFRTHALPHS